MSGFTKSIPEIILDDIDSYIGIKEEPAQDMPKSSPAAPNPKAARGTSLKKWKASDSSPYEGLSPYEIHSRMLSLIGLGCQDLIKDLHDSNHSNAQMKKAIKGKDLNISNLQNDLDMLKGELTAIKSNHAKELVKFKDRAKKSIAILVLQGRIKIAYEARDAKFDKSSWNVEGWVERLKHLDG